MANFRKVLSTTRDIPVYSRYGSTLILTVKYGFEHFVSIDSTAFTASESTISLPALTRTSRFPNGILSLAGNNPGSGVRFKDERYPVQFILGDSSTQAQIGSDGRTKLFTRYVLSFNGTQLGYWQPPMASSSFIDPSYGFEVTNPANDERSILGSVADQDIQPSFIKSEAAYRAVAFSNAINTSSLFNANNKTTKTVALDISAYFYTKSGSGEHEVGMRAATTVKYYDFVGDVQSYDFTLQRFIAFSGNIGSITVTLNAPPTFTASGLTFTKNYRQSDAGVYRGYTSVSVDISNLSAKYGGDITSVVFKVANKTVSGTTNGTYTINLDDNTSLGTYTPTVTVTDSRGQVTTQSLEAFTILDYSAPSITAASVVRTDSTGAPADEDNYALITTTIGWQDFLEALEEPTVTYVDENGQAQTASVTWYTDSALQNPVTDWTALTSPVTLYGLTGGLSYLYAYPITVTPEDTRTTGNPSTVILPPAFYTMDFKAGGHGIAIGAPATTDEFYIAMDTTINMDTDFCLELDTNASSGADHDIIAAINSLGWTDVLKN